MSESEAVVSQGNVHYYLRTAAGPFVAGDKLPEPKSGGNIPFSQEAIEVSAWDLGRFRQYVQGQLGATISFTVNFVRGSAIYDSIIAHMKTQNSPLWLLAVYGDTIAADAQNLVVYGKVICTNFEPNPADVLEVNLSFTFKTDIEFDSNVESFPAAA